MSLQNRVEEMYKDHEVKPYISPERDLAALAFGDQTRSQTQYDSARRRLVGRGHYPPLACQFWYLYHYDAVFQVF